VVDLDATPCTGPARAPTKLFKALKKSSGAIAAGCEFKRVEDDTDSLTTEASVDLRQLGMKLRRNKVAVLLVDCSSAAGKEDCEIAVKEQLTAKGGFPGPMPVVRSGSITTVEDIAEAHALGASGVLLSMSEGAADEMLKACQGNTMLPVLLHLPVPWASMQ
jgi:phosphoribosylformimino-5-aminoimidazole carboxamide ribonucleotide (ProFAR) isomerase